MRAAKSFEARRAFTLIEMLVVMAIIVLLTAFLVPSVMSLKRKSYIDKSEALVKKIETALKLYYDQFLDYPPDGYDIEPGYNYQGSNGIVLGSAWPGQARAFKGTGSLVYFLCLPVTKITRKGTLYQGENSVKSIRREVVGPFLTDLKSDDFSLGDFESNRMRLDPALSKVEIIDAWGRPLEYDKVRDAQGFFRANFFDGNPFRGGGPHWSPETQDITSVEDGVIGPSEIEENLTQVFDPRRPVDTNTGFLNVRSPASPKNLGHFDLWSHGPFWSDPSDDICSWKIN